MCWALSSRCATVRKIQVVFPRDSNTQVCHSEKDIGCVPQGLKHTGRRSTGRRSEPVVTRSITGVRDRMLAGLGGVKVGFLEEVRSYMDLEGHVTIYHAGEEGDAEGIPSGPRNGKVNGTDIKGNR